MFSIATFFSTSKVINVSKEVTCKDNLVNHQKEQKYTLLKKNTGYPRDTNSYYMYMSAAFCATQLATLAFAEDRKTAVYAGIYAVKTGTITLLNWHEISAYDKALASVKEELDKQVKPQTPSEIKEDLIKTHELFRTNFKKNLGYWDFVRDSRIGELTPPKYVSDIEEVN